MSVCLQSQQPPPPSHHLSKPKGDATLKMRASVRVTRYLETWGAARPFAHLNHRESVSSSETPIPNGRRQKVGPLPPGSWVRMLLRRGGEQRHSPSLAPLGALWVVSAKPPFWTGEAIWRIGLAYPQLSWSFSSPVVDEGSGSDYCFRFSTFRPFLCVDTVPLTGTVHCPPSLHTALTQWSWARLLLRAGILSNLCLRWQLQAQARPPWVGLL